MPIDCQRATSGGKGNLGLYMGKFIERDSHICAAGIPSAQPDKSVADALQHYLLKDEVDALLSDAIIPPKDPKPLPPLHHPIPLDKRFAGVFSDMGQLINPPTQSKFHTIVEDLKDTVYSSYWKKPLGSVPDPVPMLPEGFDTFGTTFGKKTPFHGRLYDIVMPKDPPPDKTPRSKKPGYQIDRNYCTPAFDSNLVYGHRTYVDKRGRYAKCCVTDDNVILGNGNRAIINSVQANFQDINQPRIGKVLAPYGNISNVPKGYAYGKLSPPQNILECLTRCDVNPASDYYRNCMNQLNKLRKVLSTHFLPTFFRKLYIDLKYFDKEKTGWIPKDVVYKYCSTQLIRLDPSFLEPLLVIWNAFDGSRIEYKMFVHVLNYREPLPALPKIPDVPDECLNFLSTYQAMVMPGQESDKRNLAGLPSGRYFDKNYPVTPEGGCRAFRTLLPHESSMKACLNPSILSLCHVTHRDMYEKRDQATVRRVFEAAGETFTDEQFNAIWEEAKLYHSQGWVCYETFRKVSEEGKLKAEEDAAKKHEKRF